MSVTVSTIPYGYLYRITNKINGKTYIGRRKLSLDASWRDYLGSGKWVKAAIEKHGEGNFTKSFLGYAYSSKELGDLENSLILQEWLEGRGHYNATAYSPEPEAWRSKSAAELRIMRDNCVTKRRESIEQNGYRNHHRELFESRHALFVANSKDQVLDLYESAQSVKIVATKLQVPIRYVKQLLEEESVELNVRTKPGVTHSPQVKQRIAEAMTKHDTNETVICENCSEVFSARKSRARKYCSRSCSDKGKHHKGVSKPGQDERMKSNMHKRWHSGRGLVSPDCQYCLVEAS